MPVVAVYYIFNIVLVSISVKASVHILNINFRGSSKDEKRVPKWLKKILFIKKKSDIVSENDAENNLINKRKERPLLDENSHVHFNSKSFETNGFDIFRRNSLGILNS